MRTVQVQALRRGIAALGRRRDVVAEALERAGLRSARVHDAEARIPFRAFADFYEQAAALASEPCLGLRVGARSELDSYEALGYAALSSTTLGDALTMIARYLAVLEDGAETTLEVSDDVALLVYRVTDPETGPAVQVNDLGLAVLFRWCVRLAGPCWRPLAVQIEHSAPPDASAYRQLFGLMPCFDAGNSALQFDAADLARPVSSADPRLLRLMERDLASRASRLPDRVDEAEAVRRVLAGLLHRGKPVLADVAGELGLSPRTLQRRLGRQGLSFRTLRDEVRLALALGYLREPGRSVAEIALLLGYAELSAFHHAFRRWTGQAPGEWRQRAVGAKSHMDGAS